MDPLSAINNAIAAAQNLAKLRDITRHAEAKLVIADLSVQLADAKLVIAGFIEKNQRLREELKKANNTEQEVQVGEDGLYFKSNGDGPYCTTCYDTQRKLIRVTPMGETFHAVGKWRCGVCTNKYGGTRFKTR